MKTTTNKSPGSGVMRESSRWLYKRERGREIITSYSITLKTFNSSRMISSVSQFSLGTETTFITLPSSEDTED